MRFSHKLLYVASGNDADERNPKQLSCRLENRHSELKDTKILEFVNTLTLIIVINNFFKYSLEQL